MNICTSPHEQAQEQRFTTQFQKLPEEHQDFIERYIDAMLRIQASEDEEIREFEEQKLKALAEESIERFGVEIDFQASINCH